MSRWLIVIAVAFATAVAPAGAQQGNGAYEPFPSGASRTAAEEYLAQLGVDVAERDLATGRFRSGLRPVAGDEAKARAGVGLADGRTWLLAPAALLTALPGVIVRRRQRLVRRRRAGGSVHA